MRFFYPVKINSFFLLDKVPSLCRESSLASRGNAIERDFPSMVLMTQVFARSLRLIVIQGYQVTVLIFPNHIDELMTELIVIIVTIPHLSLEISIKRLWKRNEHLRLWLKHPRQIWLESIDANHTQSLLSNRLLAVLLPLLDVPAVWLQAIRLDIGRLKLNSGGTFLILWDVSSHEEFLLCYWVITFLVVHCWLHYKILLKTYA